MKSTSTEGGRVFSLTGSLYYIGDVAWIVKELLSVIYNTKNESAYNLMINLSI